MKADIIIAQSEHHAPGMYPLTNIKKALTFRHDDEPDLFDAIQQAFVEGTTLCLLCLSHPDTPIARVLDDPEVPTAIIGSLQGNWQTAGSIRLRMLGNMGHSARLNRLGDVLFERVNKVEELSPTVVNAILE